MQQIPLNFQLKVDATFDNFIEGENALLLQTLYGILNAQPDFVFFHGESASGKTHLLQAMAQDPRAENLKIAYIPLFEDFVTPEMLDGLSMFDCVCLDGLEHIINNQSWQLSLFNLYNDLKDAGKSLVIASQAPPNDLNIELADLKSRLSAMLVFALKPLSENDKLSLLQSKAKDKGLLISDDLARYLLSRGQRDTGSLNQMLEKLDHASLQAQRKLTIPFVKQVLKL